MIERIRLTDLTAAELILAAAQIEPNVPVQVRIPNTPTDLLVSFDVSSHLIKDAARPWAKIYDRKFQHQAVFNLLISLAHDFAREKMTP